MPSAQVVVFKDDENEVQVLRLDEAEGLDAGTEVLVYELVSAGIVDKSGLVIETAQFELENEDGSEDADEDEDDEDEEDEII